MKTETALSDGNILLAEKRFCAGESFPLHWHDYFEWELILEGCAEQVCNGRAFSVRAGDSYLLSYCDLHSFRAVTEVRLLSIRFDERALPDALLCRLHTSSVVRTARLDPPEAERLSRLWETMREERSAPASFSALRISALLSELLISFLRVARETEQPDAPDAVQRAVNILHRSFRSPLTLASVARELHLSPNHLGMIFRRAVGVSFTKYLGDLRLRCACELLRTSEMTAREIAFAAGYGSAEYFAAVFRRDTGMTACEYRKKQGKEAVFY